MIHIIPVNDLKDHIEETTCGCLPSVIFEEGEMLIIHNSYDKRELIEKIKAP